MSEWKATLHAENGSEIIPPNCDKCGEHKTTYAQGIEAHAWLCGYCDCGWNKLHPAKLMGPLRDGHIRSERCICPRSDLNRYDLAINGF